MRARIFGAAASLMRLYARFQVIGPPGVKAAVPAAQNIDPATLFRGCVHAGMFPSLFLHMNKL
jgi:hypothetical protein